MSEESESTKLAAALGIACFQAQALEHAVVSLFGATLVLEKRAWGVGVRELMDARYAETLGSLVRKASKSLSLSPELAANLEDALKKRNWVMHHFFHEYGLVGLSSSLRREATERLNSITVVFEDVGNQIHALTIKRLLKSGHSEGVIRAGIQRAVESYLNEHSASNIAE